MIQKSTSSAVMVPFDRGSYYRCICTSSLRVARQTRKRNAGSYAFLVGNADGQYADGHDYAATEYLDRAAGIKKGGE